MASDDALRPETGARFLLDRVTGSTYRAVILTPDATYAGTAELAEDGTFSVTATDAPAELHDMLVMQAKLLARGAAKRRTDGLPVWPQRLLRWRGPGR